MMEDPFRKEATELVWRRFQYFIHVEKRKEKIKAELEYWKKKEKSNFHSNQ